MTDPEKFHSGGFSLTSDRLKPLPLEMGLDIDVSIRKSTFL